eukprot:g42090.t1
MSDSVGQKTTCDIPGLTEAAPPPEWHRRMQQGMLLYRDGCHVTSAVTDYYEQQEGKKASYNSRKGTCDESIKICDKPPHGFAIYKKTPYGTKAW